MHLFSSFVIFHFSDDLMPLSDKLKCKKCNKTINSNQRAICCDICDRWYHQSSCAALSCQEYEKLASSSDHWYCSNCLCDILPFNHIVDDQDFQRCITMPMFDILFDVSRYDNLIFKPLENHFVTNNNNVYIPPHKPLSWKYLLPDEYNDIISLNDLSILHVNCRSMHNFRNFNNLILYLKLLLNPSQSSQLWKLGC